jgi:PAS domain S-box-containing protein
MTEKISITKDELAHLKERASKCSMDKSYLQLVIRLMNRVSAASGLEDTLDSMLRNILDVVGGTNIILYYWIDSEIFSADVYGKRMRIDSIDDDMVQQVIATREAIEFEHPFSDTMMLTPEFTKACTWVYPLLVGTDIIGIFKMENLHIGMRDLYQYLPTFFSFVALVLKNEILGYTRLKQAYDRLSETNAELTEEIDERERAEEELLKARDELEERVAERTAELQSANERLQHELAERELAQEAVRKYSEEIQDLYDHAPCGYHSLDRDGIFTRMNDTELQWLGYTRDEIIGKMRFSDLVTGSSLQTFRENFPRFMEQGWVKDLEFEMVRRDGTILPVLLSATVVYDDDGNYLKSRSTVYDITERRKAQEKEHLLSAIVQSSADAIVAKDLDGVILSWNWGAERIYGYSAEEAVGKSISMLVTPDHPNELAEIMTRLRQGERIEHYTTERLRKDGQRISISLTVSPILNWAGNIVGASTIAHDITGQVNAEEEILRLNKELEERVEARTNDLETKRNELTKSQKALMNIVEDLNQKTAEIEAANAKLQELERLKSMFIASMSHELRTPLNSIIGFSSILLNEWLGPVSPEQKENLATILRSGKHLLNLINDVIDVSKIEAGKIEIRFEQFDLYELISEAVQYVEKDIREKGLELHLELQHQTVCTDRRRLLQCIINLLSNALKFTEQGVITVETSREIDATESPFTLEGASVSIAVHDTGIGIAAEDIPRLFQPFVRLDSPTKTAVPGTGLGLYLTRKLVDDVLHGIILCTSSIGVGSTFTIGIPEGIE